jgi:hypothetical protein
MDFDKLIITNYNPITSKGGKRRRSRRLSRKFRTRRHKISNKSRTRRRYR